MKKFLIISAILFLSSCKRKGDNGKVSEPANTTPAVTTIDSSLKDEVDGLRRDTADLGGKIRRLQQDKVRLINDTAGLAKSNRDLIAENQQLKMTAVTVPPKGTEDCTSMQQENKDLKKQVQRLTISNAALEREKTQLSKLVQKKSDSVRIVQRGTGKGSIKNNRAKNKTVQERYLEVFQKAAASKRD